MEFEGYASGREPSLIDLHPMFVHMCRHDRKTLHEYEEALERARSFRKKYVDPRALEVDRQVMKDPAYVADDILRAAGDYRFFSMLMPKVLGGMGCSLGSLIITIEELGAGCVGLANLIFVNGLALVSLASTGEMGALADINRLLRDGEKSGHPKMLSTAITEPGAGTDVEDPDLLRTARLVSQATPVKGGYLLNGRKVFISNGSIAHTHMIIMPTDRSRPVESYAAFLVETGTPGFSIGRVEHKMGQKACPAAELVFENCFIPEKKRVGANMDVTLTLELTLGLTRGCVGFFGAAVARGAFEKALHYARGSEFGGKPMIEHQWVQFRLIDMFRNAQMARIMAAEALLSNQAFGLYSTMAKAEQMNGVVGLLPEPLFNSLPVGRLLNLRGARVAGAEFLKHIPESDVRRASGSGAMAKYTGSDLGMINSHMAVELMGTDGLRHDAGAEKIFRDAKLLQIYEGTNQLNRIDVFKKSFGRTDLQRAATGGPA